MKKVIKLLVAMIILMISCSENVVVATEASIEEDMINMTATPTYNPDFDSGNGIFYANGVTITIEEDEETNMTTVYWNGGQQQVKDTVKIIGGGKEESEFETSNIKLNSGTVKHLYGGGASLLEEKTAIVVESNIEVNGGLITAGVYGGGLLYSTVNESNITINGGTIAAVSGGGAASASIDGISYSAGTKEQPQDSKNRVEIANTEINNGIIDTAPSNYGLVNGAGQGYSYVGTANLSINDGDLSKAYVTSAGSNGYTRTANTKISGGNILFIQTVNRGKLENAIVRINGGSVENAFVGGEDATDVDGIVEKVDFAVIGGQIQNLNAGTSGASPLIVEQENYKAVFVDDTIVESSIGESEIKITYELEVDEDKIVINEGKNKKIGTKITTEPEGHEGLFENEIITWSSSDESIVTVNEEGIISALKTGDVEVTANLLGQEKTIEVNVIINEVIIFIGILLISIIAVILIVIVLRENIN